MLQRKELGLIKLNIEYRSELSELKVLNQDGYELKVFNGEEAEILFKTIMGYEEIEIIYGED